MTNHYVPLHTQIRNWIDQANRQAIGQLRLKAAPVIRVRVKDLEHWALLAQQLHNAYSDEVRANSGAGQVPTQAEQKLILIANLVERSYSFNTENGKGKAVLNFLLRDDVKHILEHGTMPEDPHDNYRL